MIRSGFVGVQRTQTFAAQLRAQEIKGSDDKQYVELTGYASTVEQPYQMYDFMGPYLEVIDRRAFDRTLATNPEVHLLLNHKGVAMARTHADTLKLAADEQGLAVTATVNPKRGDVSDMLLAIEDGAIAEMSFAFEIKDGSWSPDYTEYRIKEVDLNRGDVSVVNYGANPNTTIAERAAAMFAAIETLEGPNLEMAYQRLGAKLRGTKTGTSISRLRAELELDRV